MSLFDVIKYPLSKWPTVQEMASIPPAIMREYRLRLKPEKLPYSVDFSVALLKQCILEHDDESL